MRVGKPGLRTTIVGTVAVVVLATTAVLALVAFGVVRSNESTVQDDGYSAQAFQIRAYADTERLMVPIVTAYAKAKPTRATAAALTQYVQVTHGLTYMGVLDTTDTTSECTSAICWDFVPEYARLQASQGKTFTGGATDPDGEDVRGVALTPLGSAVGNGHLVLAATSFDFVGSSQDSVLWYRMLIVIGSGVALSVLAGLLVAFSVRRPLRRIAGAARRFGEGDLAAQAPQRGNGELAQLGQVFNTMAGRLGRTLSQLHASQDLQRQFVADVSHELRTPLSTMVATLNALDSDSPDDRARAVRLLSTQTRRLAGLVDDLLEISRFDVGQAELTLEVVDLVALTRDAAGAVAPDVEISVAATGSPLWPVDPRRMHTVVRNLVGNAVLHGVAPVTVVIDSTHGDHVRLHVVDGGPGIDEQTAARIFGRFAQGDVSRSSHDGGTGLGLAIVRENVALHGGTIDVSHTGPTRFTVTLPRPTGWTANS